MKPKSADLQNAPNCGKRTERIRIQFESAAGLVYAAVHYINWNTLIHQLTQQQHGEILVYHVQWSLLRWNHVVTFREPLITMLILSHPGPEFSHPAYLNCCRGAVNMFSICSLDDSASQVNNPSIVLVLSQGGTGPVDLCSPRKHDVMMTIDFYFLLLLFFFYSPC